MNIETNISEDHQAHLKVEFDLDQLTIAKHRAARKIAQQTKIPGFRPGKAPYPIVARTVGEGAILEEAMEILVEEQYPKVIEEANIKPYGPGQLENIISMDPPIFEFIVPLDAEVTLGDYQTIRISYELPSIQEADVDKVIFDLRDRQAVLEAVDRPAEQGDQVFIRLNGERLDPSDNESTTLVADRPMPVTITAEDVVQPNEWPFAGFSRTLVGLSAGDENTIQHTFADDASYTSLRGKTAEFKITVETVKSRTLPEINDDFAHSAGEFESMVALRTEIRKSLEAERTEEYEAEYNDRIAEELYKIATWKYPPQMLEHEIELFKDQLENRLAQQNMDLPTYLKIRQLDEAGLKEDIKPLAEQRMKRTLVLMEIARQQDIKVTEQELEAESMRTLDQLSHMLPPDKARKTLTDEFVRGMIGNIGADLLIKRTWEYLHTITKKDLTADSVMPITAADSSDVTDAVSVKTDESAGTADIGTTAEPPKKKRTKKKEVAE